MKTKRSLRQHLLATLLTISVSGPIWASGNPDIVGILAAITEPANAAELGLSQDQIDKLESLIKEHEGKALDFSSQIRSLPSTERRAKEMENIRSVEKRGMDLLSDQQRVVAEKWRLQKLGPMALLDSETAKQFAISEEQIAKMQNILEGRRALMRSVGPEKAREEISKRLTDTLTEEQKTKWTQLVGAPASSGNAAQEASPSDAVGQPGSVPANLAPAGPGNAAEARPPVVLSGPADGLLLNFGGTPWKEVLTFVAREAELSMQTDIYPSGTFTYRDPYRKYTVAEALDIMNGQLLTKGFTLIKKQRTLMVIDLSSAESADVMRSLIRESVELVSPEELDQRGEYELVKCIFTLQRTSVDEIEKAVKSLYGPQGSVVSLPTAGQILVTETGGKLRIIRDTIQRSENPEGPRSAKIVRINLKYVSAEEVLAVARTHLGLKELENKADDISISMDAFGNTIFASGSADKLQKLQDLVRELDTKPDSSSTSAASQEQPVVRTHDVMGSDPETTKAVLESFFAGQPNINLALDPKTNKIVLRATPSDHDAAVKLIQELAGQSSTFEIVPLGGVDIQVAIQTLERMYGKIPKDKDPATIKGPIYQADPLGRQLMVKGTQQEIEQIRLFLSKLEDTGPKLDGFGDGVRMIPLRGKAADRLLQQIEMLKKASGSRIKIQMPKKPAAEDSETKAETKATSETSEKKESESGAAQPTAMRNRSSEVLTASFIQESATPEPSGAQTKGEVQIMEGPAGLIVASDDPQALIEFDKLSAIAQEQMKAAGAEPTIRFLEYITAAAASELIQKVIAGEQATGGGGGGGGGLLGEVASTVLGGGGLFGSLFGGGSSSSTTASAISGASTTGQVVITPDARLNALWIQANPIDAMFIEDLINLIDVENSPATIRTRGTPRLIQVNNTPVADVEAVVKQVFAGRIAQEGGGGGGQQQGQPSPDQILALLSGRRGGGAGGRGGSQTELKEQTMTISSDKKNNALIVVAPKQLFEDVESLVRELDARSEEDEQTIRTLQLDGTVSPTVIQNAVSSLFGSSVKTSATSTPQTNTSSTTTATQQQNPFNQFRSRTGGGGFGGFGGGNPFGGGGASPFGGGGNPFGGGGSPFGGGGGFRQGGGGFQGMGTGGGGRGTRGGGGGNFGGGGGNFGGGGGGGNRGNRN